MCWATGWTDGDTSPKRQPMTEIHFNQPFLTGKETDYIRQAVESGKISGNGLFTQRCQLDRNYEKERT